MTGARGRGIGASAVLFLLASACSDNLSLQRDGAHGMPGEDGSNGDVPYGAEGDSTETSDAMPADVAAPPLGDGATPPLPEGADAAFLPDGSPPPPDAGPNACGGCAPSHVCCTAPLGCAGQCVPDCRLGGACPDNLTCNASNGVCSPAGGGPPSADGGGPPPDAGGFPSLDGGGPPRGDGGGLPPPSDGGAAPPADSGGLPPPPDGGGLPPPPDGGGLPPPPDGGGLPPPPDGGGLPPPPDGGGLPPPSDGGAPPPAPDGGSPPPPQDGGGPPLPDGGLSPDGGGLGGGQDAGTSPPTGSGAAEALLNGKTNAGPYRGNNVGIHGDTVAIGSNGSVSAAGSVNVYRWSGAAWTLEQTVMGSNAKGFEWFGASLDLDQDRMIVGAFYGDAPMCGALACSGPGAAYVFSRSGSTWTQEAELVPSGTQGTFYFGWAVGLSGTTAAVGMPRVYNAGSGSNLNGAVQIFTRNRNGTWSHQTDLLLSSVSGWEQLGSSVSLSGNTLVAGAPGDWNRSNGSQIGSAYVYTGSGSSWTQQAKLDPSDGVVHDLFGYSVAQATSLVVVGAPGHAVGSDTQAGAAYVFAQVGGLWTQTAKLVAPDESAGAEFGYTVAAASSTRIVVGAPGVKKLYSFTLSNGTWTNDAQYTGCSSGSIGTSLDVSGNLAASAATSAWVFDLADPNTACVGP